MPPISYEASRLQIFVYTFAVVCIMSVHVYTYIVGSFIIQPFSPSPGFHTGFLARGGGGGGGNM